MRVSECVTILSAGTLWTHAGSLGPLLAGCLAAALVCLDFAESCTPEKSDVTVQHDLTFCTVTVYMDRASVIIACTEADVHTQTFPTCMQIRMS